MDDKSNVKKEIDGSLPPRPRKGGLKFAPKKPPKKPAKVVPKTEPAEESKDEIIDKELLMKLKTSQITDPFGRRPKIEKKEINTQVALGKGTLLMQDLFLRGIIWQRQKHQKNTSIHGTIPIADYPITLPLRRPYSGDPEILDEEEFGENSASRAHYGEFTAADELGLTDWSDTPQLLSSSYLCLFLYQSKRSLLKNQMLALRRMLNLPQALKWHVGKHSLAVRSKICQEGLMGKIHVYKSGKVKMKIGDALFDVSPGSNCMFVQEAVVVNTRENHWLRPGRRSVSARLLPPTFPICLVSTDKMGRISPIFAWEILQENNLKCTEQS